MTRTLLLGRASPRRPSLVAVQGLSMLLLASLSVGAAAQTQFAPPLLPGVAQYPVPFNPQVPVLADFDGDGGLDLLANDAPNLFLFVNNGLGEFRDESATRLPPPPFVFGPRWMMADDVDRDRDLDILVVDGGGPVRIYINNGRGVFADETATRFLDPSSTPHASWGAMGDLDGDGDRDLLVDTFTVPPYAAVYLNDGTGVFRPAAAMIQGAFYLTVSGACADLDGNGTDEILLTKFGCRLFVNTGSAFASRPFPVSAEVAGNVAIADVDGDGDLDVLQGSVGQNRLYLNLGNLQFVDATATRMPKDTDASYAYAGDLDSDGAVDCFMANGYSLIYQADRFYRNDGAGNFADVTAQRMIQTGEPSKYAALGDVDRDGDLDVLTTEKSQVSLTYYANRLRHVTSVASPRVGATWQVSVYDRPRFSTQAALGYLLLNSALLQPPVRVGQFGWLGVSVTGLIPWAPVLIPAPAGVQTIQIPVPAQAFLVGTPVVAQAVIVPAVVSGARLTNVLHDVIQ